jgi:hypothetical protein
MYFYSISVRIDAINSYYHIYNFLVKKWFETLHETEMTYNLEQREYLRFFGPCKQKTSVVLFVPKKRN